VPRDPSPARAPLLLDANVLIDLVKLGCLAEVAGLPRFEMLVVDEVVAELTRPAQARSLERAMEDGLVARVSLGLADELAQMASLTRFLGAGEAASLAYAASRDALLATDEQQPKLMREVRALIGEERLVRTTDLLAAAVTSGALSLERLGGAVSALAAGAATDRDRDDVTHLERVVARVSREVTNREGRG